MQTFDLETVRVAREQAGKAWLEFLRVPSLSVGIYHLKAGQDDPQRPHTEDEVYLVVAGRGNFRCGDETRAVSPGSILFVGRQVEHRFLDITEDLTLLVFFAPAEGSTPVTPASPS
jgi:mannose-6-phosphate isomerase-like protein (cupin superfamily)